MYPSVAVIMSTFNGENYLKEQIESILNQINVDVSIFIRDDGSTDNTINIIEEYIRNGAKIDLEIGENCGPGSSFMRKLYSSPDSFEYYSYSDQDDIWLPDKLSRSIYCLRENKKQLYMSNLMCIDKDGNEIGLRNTDIPNINPYSILCSNETNGCTMVFTNQFYRILTDKSKRPDEILFSARCHDTWTAIIGVFMDAFVYDYNFTMLYRQHDNNVVGATNKYGFRKKISAKIKKLKNTSKRNGRSKLAKEVCLHFPELVKDYPYFIACSEPGSFNNKHYLIKHYSDLGDNTQGYFSYIVYVIFGLI